MTWLTKIYPYFLHRIPKMVISILQGDCNTTVCSHDALQCDNKTQHRAHVARLFLSIYLATGWTHGFYFDNTIKNIRDSPWAQNISLQKACIMAKLQPSLHWATQHTSGFSRIDVNNIKEENKFTKFEDWQRIVYEKSWSRVCETHSWGMKNHINLWAHRHTNNIFSLPKHVRKSFQASRCHHMTVF